MKKRTNTFLGLLFAAAFLVLGASTARAQTFTFECVTDYLVSPDCDICNAQVQSRYFNGLLVRRSGVATFFLDCPILIRQQGTNLVFQELIYPNPQTVTISVLGTSYADIDEFKDSVLCCVQIDTTGGGGTTETFANSSDSTSHTVTLTPGTTSFTVAEGTGIGIATTGDADNGVATITNTAPDQTVTITGGGINVVTGTYPNFTVTGTEVDGSVTNEIQTIANTSDANSHTATLSNSGGSIEIQEGDGIALATSGTTADGIVTVSQPNKKFLTRTLPTTVGNTVQVGSFSNANGNGLYVFRILANDYLGQFSFVSKQYEVTSLYYSTTGIWNIVPPVSSAVASPVIEDFQLEMLSTITGVDSFRIRKTVGTGASVAKIEVIWGDPENTVFTEQSGTASPAAVTDIIPTAAFAHISNKVGILTVAPQQDLHVEGTLRVTESAGTPDSLLGRSAAGDVSNVAFSPGISMPGGVLTVADTSAINEAWTIGADAGDTELISNQTVLYEGAGGIATDYDAATNTLTIDGSGITPGGTNYQTWRDDGTPATQRPNANFVSTSDIAFTLTDDAGNTETEVTADIPLGAVDLDEIQDISTGVLLGNSTVSPGPPMEITPGTGITLASSVLTTEQGGEYFTRALPTTVGNTVQLFTLTKLNGVGSYQLSVQAEGGGVSVSKQYLINSLYDATANTWRIMQPVYSTGAYVGQDFVLEINGHNQRDSLRVRRTSGTTAATLHCDLSYSARTSTTFTEQSAEETPAAVTLLYPLAALAQSANKVGVNTVAPSRDLHVVGEALISDLTTTNPDGLVGADANGVLSKVTLGSGVSLTGTTLNVTAGGFYQTLRDDGTPLTQQPNANFVSSSTVTATLTNDGANSETEISLIVPNDGIGAAQIAAGAVGTSELATNGVANDDIRQSAGLSVIGRSANTTGNVADITGTVQTSPQVRGTALGFHPIPTKTFFSTVTMPSVVGNTTEIGVLTHNETGRGAMAELYVNFAASGAVTSKRYFIPLVFNSAASGWVKLLPISSAGIYDAAQDFEVEMRTNTSGAPSGGVDTLRVVRTAGTVAGTADVVIQYHGSDVDGNTFTQTSSTSTSAVTATFSRQAIAQVANRLGVNTHAPVRSLDVNGEVRIRDLTTDTPTRIVGADADGDLDDVSLTDELAISAGTLGTNFSTTISPATLTAGMTNNWNPTGLSTAWIIRVAGDNEFQIITGITAPSFNKSLKIWNVGTNSILLANDHQSSTAGNRFAFGRDVVLFAGKSIEICYDVTTARWRLISKAGIYDDVEHLYFNKTFNAPVSGTSGDYDFWEIDSESGISAVNPVSGRNSGIAVNTGAAVDGAGYVASKEQFWNANTTGGTATWGYVKAVINTPTTLSDGTDNYVLRIGFLDATVASDLAEGAYFYYNHSVNSGAWSCYTQNSGSSQNNNSGVTVAANTVYVLEVLYRPDLTAEFFINGTRVATNSSQVPSNDNMKVTAEIEKQGGTSQRTLNVYTLQTSTAFVD